MPETHVHDCTGADRRCECGYVFTVPPVSLLIDVGYRGDVLFSEAFMCESLAIAAAALRKAADELELAEEAGATQTPRRLQ